MSVTKCPPVCICPMTEFSLVTLAVRVSASAIDIIVPCTYSVNISVWRPGGGVF
jgi:hypothetical protein